MKSVIKNDLTVSEALKPFQGKKVFFDELTGNNGDDLIANGVKHAIKAAGAACCSDPADADGLIVNGGAGFSSLWGGGFPSVKRYSTSSLGDKPLIVMPSTISIETFDLPGVCAQRAGTTTVFARDRNSFENIRSGRWAPNTALGLDHDMAFHMADSEWLQKLTRRCCDRHILIVERRDAESLSGDPDQAVPVPNVLKRLIPTTLKRQIKLQPHEKNRRHTKFADWAKTTIAEEFPEHAGLPVRAIDVSLKGLLSFDAFAKIIAESAVVLSTRLHVAILASLLEKPTLVVPGDTGYGKIQAVFDYSLHDRKDTRLLKNPFA